MYDIEALRGIFVYFCIFDRNHLAAFLNSQTRVSRVLYTVLKTIILLFFMSSLINPFQAIPITPVEYVYAGATYFTFIIVLVEMTESCVRSTILNSIARDVQKSIDCLNVRSDMKVQVEHFSSSFNKKTGFYGVFIMTALILRFFAKLRLVNRYTHIVVVFMYVYIFTAHLHVAFFIHLNHFILSSLNEQLIPIESDSVNNCLTIPTPPDVAMQMIYSVKRIVMRVKSISDKINVRFGYFLLFTNMNSILNFTRAGTQLFLAFFTNSPYKGILGKLLTFINYPE